MPKTWRRLVIASLLSLTGFALSFMFDRHYTKKDDGDRAAPEIARLVNPINEVQKKQIQKLIWEPTAENEVLHVGEAIRTSANSEARIEFLHSNTAIDLEPDSAIVLEESNGQLSLDFVKGNILVKSEASTEANNQTVTLKSGDKNIELGKSEVALGKTQSGALDLQVLNGSVKGLESKSATIKVLRPMPNEPIYVNTGAGELVSFAWQPLPPNYSVALEAGGSRQTLTAITSATVDGAKGELSAKLKLGKTFFRLIAHSEDPKQPDLVSAILRAQILAKTAPVLLAPEKETVVTLNKSQPLAKFLWGNPANFNKVIIEIATSADLTKNKVIEYLENTNQYAMAVKTPGVYFWRVSGVLEGHKEIVSSAVQKFKVILQDELLPPELEFPKHLSRVSYEVIREKGLNLTWQRASGAARYRVRLESVNDKVFEDEGEFLQVKVPNLKPGAYSWSVTSIGPKGETSKPSERHTFILASVAVINWADGKTTEDYNYFSLKPTLPLKWVKAANVSAARFNLHITTEIEGAAPIELTPTDSAIDVELPKDGVYTAEVEAVDANGAVLARSAKREIRVSSVPLLPAPMYAKSLPDLIVANGSGAVTVEWQQVDGARKYVVLVKSPDGKVTKEYSYDALSAQFHGLMPGDYKIALRSVDTHGRLGPEGESRDLKVPSQSDVKAPKLKGFKVK